MSRTKVLFIVLFAAGLVLRVVSLFYEGMFDMGFYIFWGARHNCFGLAETYPGGYYPIQYQIFQFCAGITEWWFNWRYALVFKLVTLGFDLGTFGVLILILRQWKAKLRYALVYWCHPWFVSMAFLGYVDAHYTFFALLTAWLADRAKTFKGYGLAGIPLGIAFLMKPQVEVLVLAAGLYVMVRVLRHREWGMVGILVGPCAFFAAYSLFFFFSGRSILTLADSYVRATAWHPYLSAQMLNVWYPIAYILSPDNLNPAKDTMRLLGPVSARVIAMELTVAYLIAFAFLSTPADPKRTFRGSWTLLFAYGSLVLPMLMTTAHENHLFLGSAFLVVLLAMIKRPSADGRITRTAEVWAIHGLLAIQCLNVVGFYGLGDNELSRFLVFLTDRWPSGLTCLAAVLGCICFFVLLDSMFALRRGNTDGPRRATPSAVLVAVLPVIYLLVLFRR